MEENKPSGDTNENTQLDAKIVTPAPKTGTAARKPATRNTPVKPESSPATAPQKPVVRKPAVRKPIVKAGAADVSENAAKPEEKIEVIRKVEPDDEIRLNKKNLKKLKKVSDKAKAKEKEKKAKEKQKEKEKKAKKKKKEKAKKEKAKKKLKEKKAKKKAADKKKSKKKSKKK